MIGIKMADVVIHRSERYFPLEDLVLTKLRRSYVGKCFKGAYIESIIAIERKLPEFAETLTSLNGDMWGSVYFRATMIQYEIYEPIVCEVVDTNLSHEAGIRLILCSNEHAAIYIENVPDDLRIEQGKKIVVRRSESIIYPGGYTHMRTSAIPLSPMHTVVPPRCVYSVMLNKEAIGHIRDQYAELIEPLHDKISDIEKQYPEVFKYFLDMITDLPDKSDGKPFDIIENIVDSGKKKYIYNIYYSGKYYGPAPIIKSYSVDGSIAKVNGVEIHVTPVIGSSVVIQMMVEHANYIKLLQILCSNFPTMEEVNKSASIWKYYFNMKKM